MKILMKNITKRSNNAIESNIKETAPHLNCGWPYQSCIQGGYYYCCYENEEMKNSLHTYPISPIPTILMDLTSACNKRWSKHNLTNQHPFSTRAVIFTSEWYVSYWIIADFVNLQKGSCYSCKQYKNKRCGMIVPATATHQVTVEF